MLSRLQMVISVFFLLLFFNTLGTAKDAAINVTKHDSTQSLENPIIEQYNSSLSQILHTTTFLVDDFGALLTSPMRIKRNNFYKLCGIMATFGVLFKYDEPIYNAMQRNRDSQVYKKVLQVGNFFEPAGLTKNNHPYYIAGYFMGYVLKSQKMQEASIQLLESMLFEGNTRVQIMHRVVGRSRPYDDQGPYFFKYNGSRSFPSGHTSNIFQLATVLSHHVDNSIFSILAYGIATTVGLQRIDYKSHWPSDVFMGAVYGIAVSKGIIYLHEKRNLGIKPGFSMIENTPVLGITLALD